MLRLVVWTADAGEPAARVATIEATLNDFLDDRTEEAGFLDFDNRTTNAYTEGIHTKIKMIKRVSFEFRNVPVYIRKVLLSLFPLAVILSLPHFLS